METLGDKEKASMTKSANEGQVNAENSESPNAIKEIKDANNNAYQNFNENNTKEHNDSEDALTSNSIMLPPFVYDDDNVDDIMPMLRSARIYSHIDTIANEIQNEAFKHLREIMERELSTTDGASIDKTEIQAKSNGTMFDTPNSSEATTEDSRFISKANKDTQ